MNECRSERFARARVHPERDVQVRFELLLDERESALLCARAMARVVRRASILVLS